jgi:hypothetical protein
MHIEDYRLFSLSFHHRGASKFRVMVRPSSAARLEARLASAWTIHEENYFTYGPDQPI